MPGIVGLITRMPRQWAEQQLQRMLHVICHEASYVSGTWRDEAAGVYVGWTAREHSFSDRMPIRSGRGNACLVFSGEEYTDPETVSRLRRDSGTSGCEYLAHLYEEDPSFPKNLNGRFHGIVVDRDRGRVALFNDRYGMHRVYYHESNEAFCFAAEAKAILAVRPELKRVVPRSLGEFIACGCVLENRTLFQDIHVLPSASCWSFCAGRPADRACYFEPSEWEKQSVLEPEAYYRELRDVFARILPRYFGGSEPIAVSLTGGLDTRMVMAWRKPAPGSLPCYSFGGAYRESHDVRLARCVARACGQPYEVIEVGREFLSRFPHFAERTVYLTDGCSDVSQSPDLYANAKARQIAPVRMTGNYGGEVLRRVRLFKAGKPAAGLFATDLLGQVESAVDTYNELTRVHPLSFTLFRQAPWHHYSRLALEQTQVSLRSPYLDNELVRTIFRAPIDACTDDRVSLRLIAEGSPALARIPRDMGPLNSESPFAALGRRLRTFSHKAEYAYDYGMPQWVARADHLLSPLHLERLFLGRHKFYHFRIWYRDHLANYLREMLLDRRTLARPYLRPGAVARMVDEHLRGTHNHTTAIHQVLSLELVHRLFID